MYRIIPSKLLTVPKSCKNGILLDGINLRVPATTIRIYSVKRSFSSSSRQYGFSNSLKSFFNRIFSKIKNVEPEPKTDGSKSEGVNVLQDSSKPPSRKTVQLTADHPINISNQNTPLQTQRRDAGDVKAAELKTGQVKSELKTEDLKTWEPKSDQLKTDQLKTEKVKTRHVKTEPKTGQLKAQVKTEELRTEPKSEPKSNPLKTGDVKTDKLKTEKLKPKPQSDQPKTEVKTDNLNTKDSKTRNVTSGKLKTEELKTGDLKTEDSKTRHVKTGKLNSELKTGQFKTDHLKSELKTGQLKTDHLKTEDSKTRQAKTGKLKANALKTEDPLLGEIQNHETVGNSIKISQNLTNSQLPSREGSEVSRETSETTSNLSDSNVKNDSTLKPYLCERCSRRFKTKQGLSLHQRVSCSIEDILKYSLIHTEGKPLTCPYCHAPFKLSSKLDRHVKNYCRVLKKQSTLEGQQMQSSNTQTDKGTKVKD